MYAVGNNTGKIIRKNYSEKDKTFKMVAQGLMPCFTEMSHITEVIWDVNVIYYLM